MICGGKPILDKLRHDSELSGRLLQLTPPLEPLYESIFSLQSQGLKVVVLADGDPLFYGIGASLSKRVKPEGLKIRPAVSALQAACSRICLPCSNVKTVSLHGREDIAPLFTAVATALPICILTGGTATPATIARLLLDRGVDWYDVHIFERMGSIEEKHLCISIKQCANSFFNDNITLLLVPNKKPRSARLGLDERRYRGAYATKKPVRGAILEMLGIEPSNTVWDVGAGSGILSLEACTLAHEGRVIAIEKDLNAAWIFRKTGAFWALLIWIYARAMRLNAWIICRSRSEFLWAAVFRMMTR